MNSTIVTVGTVTYAIKLRRLLLRAGIRSKLVKVDNTNTEGGCSHGIAINESDFYPAVVVMKSNGIKYSVYNGHSYDLP